MKLRYGRVITPFQSKIDFSLDDIPVETSKELYGQGFPYLELTELEKKELHWIEERSHLPNSKVQRKIKSSECSGLFIPITPMIHNISSVDQV